VTNKPGGQDQGNARMAALPPGGEPVRDLHPGYFAFVMATGIISTGTFLLGPAWLSRTLLVLTVAGLGVLSVALVLRLARFRSSVAADIRAPERVFGFFTITAGLAVLAVRLSDAGHPLATAILAGVAAAVWLALTYGVPASLLLTRAHDSVLSGVNGSWLLWVVSTQSIALTAAVLVPAWPSQARLLASVATGLWSLGLVLYLLLVSLILLRWLTVPMTPQALGRQDPGPAGQVARGPGDGRLRRGVLLRAVGVRDLVDPAARDTRLLASRPAAVAADLRAAAVERGLPARHVQRRHADVRPGGRHLLHGAARPRHDLGGGGRLDPGRRRVLQVTIRAAAASPKAA